MFISFKHVATRLGQRASITKQLKFINFCRRLLSFHFLSMFSFFSRVITGVISRRWTSNYFPCYLCGWHLQLPLGKLDWQKLARQLWRFIRIYLLNYVCFTLGLLEHSIIHLIPVKFIEIQLGQNSDHPYTSLKCNSSS